MSFDMFVKLSKHKLQKNLDNLRNEDIKELFNLLSTNVSAELKNQYYSDTHFRLGFENTRFNYSDLYFKLLLPISDFEKVFNDETIKTIEDLHGIENSNDISKIVSSGIDELTELTNMPREFINHQVTILLVEKLRSKKTAI